MDTRTGVLILYYESIKGDLQTRPVNECRCDEWEDEDGVLLIING